MEEDIKILEHLKNDFIKLINKKDEYVIEKDKREKEARAIENLINKNKEQEKTIELMAQALFSKDTCLDCENVEHKKAKNKYKVCIECIKKFYTNQTKEMK